MLVDTYYTTLVNNSLTIVSTDSLGDNQTLTSLSVVAGSKVVAKNGEKVLLFAKGTSTMTELELTADLGKTTTMSFRGATFDHDIPSGSVVLMPKEENFDKVNNTDLYAQQSL